MIPLLLAASLAAAPQQHCSLWEPQHPNVVLAVVHGPDAYSLCSSFVRQLSTPSTRWSTKHEKGFLQVRDGFIVVCRLARRTSLVNVAVGPADANMTALSLCRKLAAAGWRSIRP